VSTETYGLNRETHGSNEVVFSTGEYGDAAYVIESGCVEVLAGSTDAPRRIAVLTEGAMFGEVALLDRQARTATVRTLLPTRLVRIERTHVEELLQRADPVIQYLLRLMHERFRNSSSAVSHSEPSAPRGDALAEGKAELHSLAVQTLSLAHDLADAITADQLVLHYQPILLLDGNVTVGFEALVRWQHPQLGIVSPDEFIPLAEKTGLVHRIGAWVLQRAAADWPALRAWCSDSGGHRPFMSVNLSAPELCAPGIVRSIQDCLAKYNMPAEELRIELTETVIVSSLEAVSGTLHALRALGVGIALDDFGTGYAGLGYLQTLPFSCLKIDKTFVQQMHSSQRSFHIVKSALELSRQLELSTVAEGIEDQATASALREMGTTYAQGFFFARPMPASAVASWAQQLLN
jgi:diguanylate cyclase